VIFSEPGSSSQHGKPFLLKGSFITLCFNTCKAVVIINTQLYNHSVLTVLGNLSEKWEALRKHGLHGENSSLGFIETIHQWKRKMLLH